MTPIVNGKQEWFSARGLFNGLVLLGDATTNSYWDHITGECVYGELVGDQLPFSEFDLLYTTVAGALQSHPGAQLARSQPGLRQAMKMRLMGYARVFIRDVIGISLPPHFIKTMGEEDTRRDRMDMGLGMWTETTGRYYPLDVLQAQPSGILDQIDGQTVFIYYNAKAKAPDAFYMDANSTRSEGETFIFDTGVCLQDGKLFDAHGEMIAVQRPQQMFTRWYGFAYTFPGCDIFEGETQAQPI